MICCEKIFLHATLSVQKIISTNNREPTILPTVGLKSYCPRLTDILKCFSLFISTETHVPSEYERNDFPSKNCQCVLYTLITSPVAQMETDRFEY